MNNIIYDNIVDARVGKKIGPPVFMNQKGELVEECYQYGMKVDTKLIHPNIVFLLKRPGATLP